MDAAPVQEGTHLDQTQAAVGLARMKHWILMPSTVDVGEGLFACSGPLMRSGVCVRLFLAVACANFVPRVRESARNALVGTVLSVWRIAAVAFADTAASSEGAVGSGGCPL